MFPSYYTGNNNENVPGEYEGLENNIIIAEDIARESQMPNFVAMLYHEMAHLAWGPFEFVAIDREQEVGTKYLQLLMENRRKIECCFEGRKIGEMTDAWEDILEKCDVCIDGGKKCRKIRACGLGE